MSKEKFVKDKRLLMWLNNKGINTQQKLREFLNPSFSQIEAPLHLNGVSDAVLAITNGIKYNKKFVIVGDYDCDGIMASTVLYRYFLSQNANVEIVIPNRFDDGYGLNEGLVIEICNNIKPDILITVDLGISCAPEIEILKQHGVEVIVTDHHEPPAILPDCITIDPKIKQDYGCDYLCGTGVAYKLVSALAGFKFANSLLDIVAIATIGDIVPLLGENRAIASLGLEKLSKKDYSLPSLELLFETLKLDKVSSTDIYLKIVPKLNASGRMDNGKKVFDFINCEDKTTAQNLLAEILADNALRLDEINKSIAIITEEIKSFNIVNLPIICVKGDFHQGILGILASRLLNDYNRPALVFARTENGTYKASGRSIESIDLFSLISKSKNLCEHFGGHKMAVGLEIKEENYDVFVKELTNNLSNETSSENIFIKENSGDIEISTSDINSKFLTELNLLSPFGCNNEKPMFIIKASGALPIKQLGTQDSTHLKISLDNANIIYFGGKEHKEALLNNCNKELILDLEFNYFKNKVYPQAIIKSVNLLDTNGLENKDNLIMSAIICKCKSMLSCNQTATLTNIESFIKLASDSRFGYAIIANTKEDYKILSGLDLSNFTISDNLLLNKQNVVVLNSGYNYNEDCYNSYKAVLFMHKEFNGQFNFIKGPKIYKLNSGTNNIKISDIRNKCKLVYSAVAKQNLNEIFGNIIDYCNQMHQILPQIKAFELCICLYGLAELGLICLDNLKGFYLNENNTNNSKVDLFSSSIIKYFGEL